MTPREKCNKAAAETVINALRKRNMGGSFAATGEDAVRQALEFLKPGMTVSSGGSMTLGEIGMMRAAADAGCAVLERRKDFTPDESREFYAKVSACDCYFMSTNAITMDGQLYNVDGSGNRVSSLIFGPGKVVIIAGMNKVVLDTGEAEARMRRIAAPLNATRLDCATPCTLTGKCSDCQSPDCICCNTVITRRGRVDGRIHVILVGQELGY